MRELLGGLVIAALSAGCCDETRPVPYDASAGDSGDADVATDVEQSWMSDACNKLAHDDRATISTCNYYRDQCVAQRGSDASSYRLTSPLFAFFPAFDGSTTNRFEECVQQSAGIAHLLGPLPYATFSRFYGDVFDYARKRVRHEIEPFSHPGDVDPSLIAGILALLGNNNLGTNAMELESSLHVRILAAHRSRSEKKTTVFIFPDVHDDVTLQNEIVDSVGTLNRKGVALVGDELLKYPLHAETEFKETKDTKEWTHPEFRQQAPLAKRAGYRLALRHSNVFGVVDDKLGSMLDSAASELLDAQQQRKGGCDQLNKYIEVLEKSRWQSYAMASNLAKLMYQKHEAAAALIVGGMHVADVEEFFDAFDINCLVVATPATMKSSIKPFIEDAQFNESMLEGMKKTCGGPLSHPFSPIAPYGSITPTF